MTTYQTVSEAPNINHFWAQLIVEELVRSGVDFFCLAPGSRSTPLTTAVARHPKARQIVHFDERGSAFFAVGYARATQRPAAWITTSGTAVANGFPAVVEASTDQLPLILLTADRPPELRATGANQTIDQVKIFGEYVKTAFDLPTPDPSLDPAMVLTTVDQLVHQAQSVPHGPVHLNCMFRKPLAPEEAPFESPPEKEPLRVWYRGDRPYTSYTETRPSIPTEAVKQTAKRLASIERGLVVAGRLHRRAQGEAVQHLATRLQWPVLPDIGSQIRLGGVSRETIPYFDQMLTSTSFQADHRPELVIQFGGRCTSKRFRQFLAAHPPERHIVIKEDPYRFDANHSVSHSIETNISSFCRQVVDRLDNRAPSPWLKSWRQASQAVDVTLDCFTGEKETLTEPHAARLISHHIPADHGLFLASSRPVRDVDMFAAAQNSIIPVGANRGASGIDGTVASAAGFSRGLNRPVTLLIGDLALLHDLNSLAILRDAPFPLVIVVINNNGGGIFSFLPIANYEDVFESHFATPFNVTFEQAASMFDLAYHQPDSKSGFVRAYQTACENETSTLIEVQTDRERNVVVHAEIQEAVQETLS